jgi:proteasome lid subunit RPN8/RPN11
MPVIKLERYPPVEFNMTVEITSDLLEQITIHGEASYPEEGAGFLLGRDDGVRQIEIVLPLPNVSELASHHNRYLISPQDYLRTELEAERSELSVLGIFHSHPDHSASPSEYDQEWALPWFTYIITSIQAGKAVDTKSWRLLEDRTRFTEEPIRVIDQAKKG